MGGQGIADGSGVEFSEFQQTEDMRRQGLFHRHCPAVELHTGSNGIHALFCLGDVGGFSVDIHIDLAGAGHQLVHPAEYPAFFQPRPQMQAKEGFDLVFFQYTGLTLEALRAQMRPQAEKQVKIRLALEKIAELEALTVTDEEVEAEYTRISEAYNVPADQVKGMIAAEDIKADLLVSHAMDLVKANAKVKEPAKKTSTTKKTAAAKDADAEKAAPAEKKTTAAKKTTTTKKTTTAKKAPAKKESEEN